MDNIGSLSRLLFGISNPILFTFGLSHQRALLKSERANFVLNPEDYLYSSAKDYAGQKGLLDILLID